MTGTANNPEDTRTGTETPMDPLWDAPDSVRSANGDPALVIDVDGFEGPLDLLLHLARTQKVDISRISVLALAEQYLAFIDDARRLRLEIAADYLVMAAWLAFLKSRLLIPKKGEDEEPTGEEMAAQLAFRLKRLEAMRDAATRIINRNRLGREVFERGDPEPVVIQRKSEFVASLYDLLNSYASIRQRTATTEVTISKRIVWSLSDARVILQRMIGALPEWTALDQYLVRYLADPSERRTVIASAFAASLELVREGQLEIRQEEAFSPIYLRRGPKTPGDEIIRETVDNG